MVIDLKSTNTSYLERTTTITTYYRDIRRYKLLSDEETAQLFHDFRHGSEEVKAKAREALINHNQRFVISAAKKFANDDTVLDLVNEGNIGLMEAIDSYDPSKGAKFTTWAIYYIRRAINFYKIEHGSIVQRTNSHKTHHVISKATNKFVQRELREPTTEELAEMLKEEYGIEIKNMRDLANTNISSIDSAFGEEDEDRTIGDAIEFNNYTASSNSYEETSSLDFNKELVNRLLNGLSEREATIMKMLYGVGYERPYEIKEVSEKCGLTTERVRQLKHSSLLKLRTKYQSVFEKL